MSTLKVSNIQDISNNAAMSISGGVVTATNAIRAPGMVLQTVVHQEEGATRFTADGTNDELLIASNAADSTSHLSLSITPTSTSSKILLTARVFHELNSTANHTTLWSFYRDSTKLAAPIAGSRRSGIAQTAMGYYNADADSTADTVSYNYYDSPNTTSAITYIVSFNHTASNVILNLNRTHSDLDAGGHERGVSILIAQEIGG